MTVDARRGVGASIEESLREAVRSQRLRVGEKLPSARALAHDLGVARGTVASAYAQLVAEGWLSARRGSGTSVAYRPEISPQDALARPGAEDRPRFDLRPGRPDLSEFPRRDWLASLRRALSAAPYWALDYSDPQGRPELRGELAAYLGRTRGVRASADNIVICSGFAHAISLLAAVVVDRGGQMIAMEDPCLRYHRSLVARAGLDVGSLVVDDAGACVDSLSTICDGASAAVVTPAHQHPIGVPLASARRSELVRIARERGVLVIEDDYDGEFRYDRQPVGALQSLDPDGVVYAGTASKTLTPGIRLGWLVLPAALVEEVLAAKRRAAADCSALDQLALADLIKTGVYDRHVRRMRLRYHARRQALESCVGAEMPGARLCGAAAGLSATVRLPEGVGERAALTEGSRRGVAVHGLAAAGYSHAEDSHPAALVVGFATPPEHSYRQALGRLAKAVVAAS